MLDIINYLPLKIYEHIYYYLYLIVYLFTNFLLDENYLYNIML